MTIFFYYRYFMYNLNAKQEKMANGAIAGETTSYVESLGDY